MMGLALLIASNKAKIMDVIDTRWSLVRLLVNLAEDLMAWIVDG